MYYGQSDPKEDYIASQVFKDFIGTAIEVGAFDGVHLSNVKHFYDHGWRVVNFEPHPDNYAALCVNQPKAINKMFAVTNHRYPKTVAIQTTPGKPIVTGFDLPDWYIESEVPGGRAGLETMWVKAVCLDAMLEHHKIDTVDYVSIDTDGTELEVLWGFNVGKYNPRLFIVEYNAEMTAINKYMGEWGYTLAHTNTVNAFYTRTQADYDAVRRAVR
jgi:FkbM family methyltransferase